MDLHKTDVRVLRFEGCDNLSSKMVKISVAAVPEFCYTVMCDDMLNLLAQAQFEVIRNVSMTKERANLCHDEYLL